MDNENEQSKNAQDDPIPDSRAPYIIICNGRIGVKWAQDSNSNEPDLAIVHASETAMALISFYDTNGYKYPAEIVHQISDEQHWLMDHMSDATGSVIDSHIEAMFTLFDTLEREAKK